jgi:hypothetical protein
MATRQLCSPADADSRRSVSVTVVRPIVEFWYFETHHLTLTELAKRVAATKDGLVILDRAWNALY